MEKFSLLAFAEQNTTLFQHRATSLALEINSFALNFRPRWYQQSRFPNGGTETESQTDIGINMLDQNLKEIIGFHIYNILGKVLMFAFNKIK